jgi:hypothetical protein
MGRRYLQNYRVRAICHIPTGWVMGTVAQSPHSLAVEGQASSGIYQLDSGSLTEMNGLLLVEKPTESVRSDDEPHDQLDGDLYLDVDGKGPHGTVIPLNSKFIVEAADRCPPPER